MRQSDQKPTLDYAKPNRSDERRKMWRAIQFCMAIFLITTGLFLLGAVVIFAIRSR